MFLRVLLPLKKVQIPYLSQMFLLLSHRPYIYSITMYPFDFFDSSVIFLNSVVGIGVLGPVLLEVFMLHSIKTHVGYIHMFRMTLRCSS